MIVHILALPTHTVTRLWYTHTHTHTHTHARTHAHTHTHTHTHTHKQTNNTKTLKHWPHWTKRSCVSYIQTALTKICSIDLILLLLDPDAIIDEFVYLLYNIDQDDVTGFPSFFLTTSPHLLSMTQLATFIAWMSLSAALSLGYAVLLSSSMIVKTHSFAYCLTQMQPFVFFFNSMAEGRAHGNIAGCYELLSKFGKAIEHHTRVCIISRYYRKRGSASYMPKIRTFRFSLHTSHRHHCRAEIHNEFSLSVAKKFCPLCSNSLKWRDCSSHRKNESN